MPLPYFLELACKALVLNEFLLFILFAKTVISLETRTLTLPDG